MDALPVHEEHMITNQGKNKTCMCQGFLSFKAGAMKSSANEGATPNACCPDLRLILDEDVAYLDCFYLRILPGFEVSDSAVVLKDYQIDGHKRWLQSIYLSAIRAFTC